MLDGIFGSGEKERLREELEEKEKRIENLRDELKSTEKELESAREERKEAVRRMEKERDRAKEAVTEKQKVDRRLNEAEHKIESLESEVERLREREEASRRRYITKSLTRREFLFLIDELSGVEVDGSYLVTNYIGESGDYGNDIADLIRDLDSETGYVHVKDRFGVINFVLVPPLPVSDEFYRENVFRLEGLEDLFGTNLSIGFVSLHAGKSAVGLLRGPEFEFFEVVSDGVKGKHSKGGFSQGRFERGRKEQIRSHLRNVEEAFERMEENLDFLVIDGNERMTTTFRENLDSRAKILERSLDIGRVKKDEKEKYVEKIWGARIYIPCD
ncbi:MAG: Vms1/Ankzf1 family peptidyl-tRNA hydrolase [Candidatus Hadarchaeota archaeon]